jgi:hypothetical protein
MPEVEADTFVVVSSTVVDDDAERHARAAFLKVATTEVVVVDRPSFGRGEQPTLR